MNPDVQAVKTWLKRQGLRGVVVGFALIGVYLFLDVGDGPRPRTAKLAYLAFAATFGLAYLPAARLVGWLRSVRRVWLLELGDEETGVALWSLTPGAWRELDVVEGELQQLKAGVPCYEVRDFDPETLEARGTWRASKTPLELARREEAIADLRGELEELARDGLAARVRMSTMVRSATISVVGHFVQTFERGAIPEGERIEDVVEETLSEELADDEEEPDEPSEELLVQDADAAADGGTDAGD